MTWIYIQTSISEGLPVSVIEAGLTGKCVICTNVGGCAELLANPNAGGWGWKGGNGAFACNGRHRQLYWYKLLPTTPPCCLMSRSWN